MAPVGIFQLGMSCLSAVLRPPPRSTASRQEGGPPRPTRGAPAAPNPTPGLQLCPAAPHVPRRWARQAEVVSEGSPSSEVDTGTLSCGQSTAWVEPRIGTRRGGDTDTHTHRYTLTHPGAAHSHGQAGQGGRGAHPEEERVLQPHGVEVHPLFAQLPAEIVQIDAARRCTAACGLHLLGQAAAGPGGGTARSSAQAAAGRGGAGRGRPWRRGAAAKMVASKWRPRS